MAWFLLARLLFVVAVVYSAVLLKPLGGSLAVNAAFGLVLAATFVAFARDETCVGTMYPASVATYDHDAAAVLSVDAQIVAVPVVDAVHVHSQELVEHEQEPLTRRYGSPV